MRTSRIIDRLTGKGNVERDGSVISEVDYEIIVSQFSNDSALQDQPEPQSAATNARGRLRVLEGKRNLIEGELTLALNDGRKWKFTVTNGNPVSALYMVVQSGDDDLTPEALQS
ncbi:MAG: hypothetical protein H8E48_09865 [Chloroflexi bacterium]|nr:hypothetical protein [Chloroflexota bacterium]